jgi:hypothetical protein
MSKLEIINGKNMPKDNPPFWGNFYSYWLSDADNDLKYGAQPEAIESQDIPVQKLRLYRAEELISLSKQDF